MLEARAHRADAVLLIVAALTQTELTNLHRRARELQLDVLCEVHDGAELQRALDAGCETIGVNNRNLHTFRVDLNTSLQLAELMPPGVVKVAESGIETGDDIAGLRQAGFDAFLIGESLMRAPRPGRAHCGTLLAQAVTHRTCDDLDKDLRHHESARRAGQRGRRSRCLGIYLCAEFAAN